MSKVKTRPPAERLLMQDVEKRAGLPGGSVSIREIENNNTIHSCQIHMPIDSFAIIIGEKDDSSFRVFEQ